MTKTIVILLAALAAGCGSAAATNAQSAPPPTAGSAASGEQPASGADEGANVAIAPEIRKACGLSDAEAYFAYNSDRLRSKDAGVLDKLARCFIDGPLKDRGMLLVGHADPRGDEEYNLVLGGRRAGTVERSMVQRGLASNRVTSSSRGEMDASGNDEPSYARDRRVDVLLAQ